MAIADLITRDCFLILRDPTGSFDGHGNAVVLDSTADAVCEIQQRSASERGESGEVSDAEWRLFFLPTVDLTTASAVQVDGEVYEIVGEPWTVRNPLRKTDSHIEVKARRTAGAEDAS